MKNGLGASFYVEKNLVVIGEWKNNNLEGLTINIQENNDSINERYMVIDENKQKKEIKDEDTISKIKKSEEYKHLKEFYLNVKDVPNPE